MSWGYLAQNLSSRELLDPNAAHTVQYWSAGKAKLFEMKRDFYLTKQVGRGLCGQGWAVCPHWLRGINKRN